jgi:hypothetical protein
MSAKVAHALDNNIRQAKTVISYSMNGSVQMYVHGTHALGVWDMTTRTCAVRGTLGRARTDQAWILEGCRLEAWKDGSLVKCR